MLYTSYSRIQRAHIYLVKFSSKNIIPKFYVSTDIDQCLSARADISRPKDQRSS